MSQPGNPTSEDIARRAVRRAYQQVQARARAGVYCINCGAFCGRVLGARCPRGCAGGTWS